MCCLLAATLSFVEPGFLLAQDGGTNAPPSVAIVSPPGPYYSLAVGTFLRITAEASDSDGFVASVSFYADTNVIGVVTNVPFSIVWQVQSKGPAVEQWQLRAIAVDNLGATTESSPLPVVYCTFCPPRAVLALDSPKDGSWFAAPSTFVLSAELVASLGDAGPVEFFVGTNSVGTVSQTGPFNAALPPYDLTVTNILQGDYKIVAQYHGWGGVVETVRNIHVTRLVTLSPRLTADSHLAFEVLTSFPGRSTVFEVSRNFLDWSPINTNVPSSNTFIFTDPGPATNSVRFYRARVPL
jgi:hypothetical protein